MMEGFLGPKPFIIESRFDQLFFRDDLLAQAHPAWLIQFLGLQPHVQWRMTFRIAPYVLGTVADGMNDIPLCFLKIMINPGHRHRVQAFPQFLKDVFLTAAVIGSVVDQFYDVVVVSGTCG